MFSLKAKIKCNLLSYHFATRYLETILSYSPACWPNFSMPVQCFPRFTQDLTQRILQVRGLINFQGSWNQIVTIQFCSFILFWKPLSYSGQYYPFPTHLGWCLLQSFLKLSNILCRNTYITGKSKKKYKRIIKTMQDCWLSLGGRGKKCIGVEITRLLRYWQYFYFLTCNE